MDRGTWQAIFHGVTRVGLDLPTKPPPPLLLFIKWILSWSVNSKRQELLWLDHMTLQCSFCFVTICTLVERRGWEKNDLLRLPFFLSVKILQFSSVQSLSRVRLFETPWITARQASLSITISQNSLRLTSIESVMPSSHLILCCPLLLLHPIPPSIRVFSSESVLCIRWPEYWSLSFIISPSNEYSGLISFMMDWIFLQSKGLSGVFSNTTVQKHQFFGTQLSL